MLQIQIKSTQIQVKSTLRRSCAVRDAPFATRATPFATRANRLKYKRSAAGKRRRPYDEEGLRGSMNKKYEVVRDFAMCIGGGILFAAVINIFIQPLHFVSGSVTGIAQLITYAVQQLTAIPKSFNLTGILLLLINLPLLYLAARMANRIFLIKTIAVLLVDTIAYSVIPIPPKPPIADPLTACVIAGLLSGYAAGITLRGGGSGGGLDIIGLYMSTRYSGFSVGKVSIIVSLAVFGATLFQFNFEIVVYSVIFTVISSAVIDRVHYQNIKVVCWIITENDAVRDLIIHQLNRSATKWEGAGIYTGAPKSVYLTVVSKYEVLRMKRLIRSIDPAAFVIVSDSSDLVGAFQVRIES